LGHSSTWPDKTRARINVTIRGDLIGITGDERKVTKKKLLSADYAD
jgi:hypothetical protein